MSFFKNLIHTIENMWKKAPAAEVAMASAINYIVPFVESLDALIIPEFAPILNPILDKVKVGLSAVKSTIQGATANGTTSLPLIVASVNANLTALVSAAQIKDQALAAKIEAVAALVTGELNAAFPPPANSSPLPVLGVISTLPESPVLPS